MNYCIVIYKTPKKIITFINIKMETYNARESHMTENYDLIRSMIERQLILDLPSNIITSNIVICVDKN